MDIPLMVCTPKWGSNHNRKRFDLDNNSIERQFRWAQTRTPTKPSGVYLNFHNFTTTVEYITILYVATLRFDENNEADGGEYTDLRKHMITNWSFMYRLFKYGDSTA